MPDIDCMKKKICLLIYLFLYTLLIYAQKDSVEYSVNFIGLSSTGVNSPFWLQSNQYGQISSSSSSADLLIGINKEFRKSPQLFNYGFKANLLLQTDKERTNAYFHELYAKARFSVFDIVLGAREEHLGNQDSTLSSGGFLLSHNVRPMPKIIIGIEHFTPVPFTNGFLEIKGAIAHGWYTDNIYVQGLLLHQKYLYAKIGGHLPVHFQYGIDHVAQWGGNISRLGQQPESFDDYIRIFLGKSGAKDAVGTDQINTLGNHIISQSMRLDIDVFSFQLGGYWQNISEDPPVRFITKAINTPDGLWGISLRNKNFPFIKEILYEYLNTTDQSGPYGDKDGIIYGGNDNYFNNGIYQNGWTYYARTIGTPFISSPIYNKNGIVSITNNRVQVHHFGLEGETSGYSYKLLASFSKNYGTYSTPYAVMIQNTSMALEINKRFSKLSNIQVGCSFGGDFGKLYGTSVGCMLSIRKTGNLFNY